jgi:hypothetical protein
LSCSCNNAKINQPQESNSYESDSSNFIITDKGDTLGRVKYPDIPGYEFLDRSEKELVFKDSGNLSKFPGKFGFGIRSKEQRMRSCWLVFQEIGDTVLQIENVPVVPFLYDEFELDKEVNVALIYNYIDSSEKDPRMFQVYAAVNAANSKDTLLFQETTYLTQKGNKYAALIIYETREKREEMRKLVEEWSSTLQRSYSK